MQNCLGFWRAFDRREGTTVPCVNCYRGLDGILLLAHKHTPGFATCLFHYPRRAGSARVIAMIACLCVCLYCIKTAKCRITQTTPRDSPENLVFWRQNSLVDDHLPPEICAQSDPPPFKQRSFDPIFTHSASTVRASKKVQLALIWSRRRAFQRVIDEPCMLPLSPPKGGTKRDFAIFYSKFKLLSKKSAAKFLRVKTFSGRVVATSFLYLTVHRWIAGDVPIYLKFALKVTQPSSISTDFA